MSPKIPLLLERDGERLLLRSPEVGLFSRAHGRGALLAPGAPAGVLHSLGRCFELVVPATASGRVVNAPPERVLAPVDHGALLYELAPLADAVAEEARPSAATSGALPFRAPCSGRFWQRPAPGAAAFVSAGDILTDGTTVGLIEVMKTFTHLVYRAGGDLPERARLVRFTVADGGEVVDGGTLLELERA
jgi:biotin carboxyl carrier protein